MTRKKHFGDFNIKRNLFIIVLADVILVEVIVDLS